MKFGVKYELSIPRPIENGIERTVIENALERAERGKGYLTTFDAATWGEPRLESHYPVSAAVGVGSVTLPELRFICKPGEMAFTGSESL